MGQLFVSWSSGQSSHHPISFVWVRIRGKKKHLGLRFSDFSTEEKFFKQLQHFKQTNVHWAATVKVTQIKPARHCNSAFHLYKVDFGLKCRTFDYKGVTVGCCSNKDSMFASDIQISALRAFFPQCVFSGFQSCWVKFSEKFPSATFSKSVF